MCDECSDFDSPGCDNCEYLYGTIFHAVEKIEESEEK